MPPVSKRPDKNRLAMLYVRQGKTQADIGREYGVTRVTVSRWLAAYGLRQQRPLWPARTVARVRLHYVELGRTLRETADQVGITKGVVANIVSANGWEPHPKGGRTPAETEDRVVQLRREGLTLSEIASHLHLSPSGVHKILHRRQSP